MVYACIDIGGTNTLIGVGADDFTTIEKVSTARFLADIPGTVADTVGTAGYTPADVDDIGVAVAGPVDQDDGVFYPPNLDESAIDVITPLQQFGPVTMLNDCNAAVIGEHTYGDRSADDMVYVTISTGIGAGAVMNGDLVDGADGNFGEIGHIVVGNDGRPCGCGGTDHWEAYCGGAHLPGMAEDLFGHQFSDARAVFAAYRDGDHRAEQVIDRMQQYNTRGMASIVNIFDPELILVGGGIGQNHDDIIVDGLTDRLAAESVNGIPSIRCSSLGEHSVLHGLRAICTGAWNGR